MSTTTATACLDLRPLPRPQRHVLVFRQFEALAAGESFELVNDHDPLGLLHQFLTLMPGRFTWDYRAQGPDEWRVLVGRTPAGTAAGVVPEGGCGCGGASGGCG